MNVLQILKGFRSQALQDGEAPAPKLHCSIPQSVDCFADRFSQIMRASETGTKDDDIEQWEFRLHGGGSDHSGPRDEELAMGIQELTKVLPEKNRLIRDRTARNATFDTTMDLGFTAVPSTQGSEDARLSFGKIPTSKSDNNFGFALADDGKAFTLRLNTLLANTERPASPISTQNFYLVLPLENGQNGGEIEFHIRGFVATRERSTATLFFNVNGQSTVVSFPAYTSRSFLEIVRLNEKTATECRIAAFLLAGRALEEADSAAFINVSAVDAVISSDDSRNATA